MTEQAPQLTLVRHYRAAPERVWAAWTDPELIVQWFGPDAGPVLEAELNVREGGRFKVAFRTEDGEKHTCLGTYLEVEPHERLSFTWEWITMPERQSQVTLGFRRIEGGTEFTLHHSRFADIAARDGHREGWTGALDKLGHLLEGDAA